MFRACAAAPRPQAWADLKGDRMRYMVRVVTAASSVAIAVGLACGQRDKADVKETPPAETPASVHKPPTSGWDEVTKTYSGEEFLAWPAGQVDGKPARVSPTVAMPSGYEVNHHRVTVSFDGAGKVELSVAHHTKDRLDEAIESKSLHTPFQSLKSGQEVVVSSSYKAECCSWLMVRTAGDVKITGVRDSFWRGKGTVFGHSPGVFEFAGGKLPYRLMYPRDYDPKKAYPLVLSVHGSGGVGTDNVRSMENVILARYLFIRYYQDKELECFSLVPQIPSDKAIPKPYYPAGDKGAPVQRYHPDWPAVNENGWYVQATLGLVRRLVEDKQINIDPDRLYFTGFSYGGKACWEFLKAGRTVFAAGMAGAGWPIGPARSMPGRLELERLKLEVQRYKHIPVYVLVGERDDMRRGSQAVHQLILDAGGKSSYVELPKASHIGAAAKIWGNREYVAWLFKQNRKNNPKGGEDPFPGGNYAEWKPLLP